MTDTSLVALARTVDRTSWGSGPWDDEPDRVDFEAAGMSCLLARGPTGAWCGYVAVPPGHLLHGLDCSEESEVLTDALERRKEQPIGKNPSFAIMLTCLSGRIKASPDIIFIVHGGLTYANKCQGVICHVPKPGRPADVWWFGFDCSHAGDISPSHLSQWPPFEGDVYQTVEYAKAQTQNLAEQLAHFSQGTD